jgi:hypothetical protein
LRTGVLRRIFGPKRDDVKGRRRKLHNEQLHDLYSSPSIIRIIKVRRMIWTGHIARMGEKRNAYRLLMGKIPLGRPIFKCGNELSGSIKCWETIKWLHNWWPLD